MQPHLPQGSQLLGGGLEKIDKASEILLSFFRIMGIETPKNWVNQHGEFDQKIYNCWRVRRKTNNNKIDQKEGNGAENDRGKIQGSIWETESVTWFYFTSCS